VNSPKPLLAISVSLLLISAVFGVLNGGKAKALRNDVVTAKSQREAAERQRQTAEKNIKGRETKVANEVAKIAENESRIASAEAELVKTQTEKSDLQGKLQANESQIAELQKHIDEMTKTSPNPNPGAPSVAELQAQLDDARKQLESAEREKTLIAEKMGPGREPSRGPEVTVGRREPSFHPSVRGTVLAVNQAYNFVVLNLGNRQGLEPNAEMLVLRETTIIGKIRISSVEPATAIGDILGNSLARGVQVQPGDTVIYASSNS
jgi:peptidoglycan hydrolase-like protein with peptidoglycan-binding domain